MIDKQLIESAKSIRKEYLNSYRTLLSYQEEVRGLSKFLLKKVEDLNKYNNDVVKKIKNKSDVSEVSNFLISEIQSIEDEEKKLTKKVDDINSKLERLKKDEENLYKSIKNRYPDLTDEEIIKEIHSKLPE